MTSALTYNSGVARWTIAVIALACVVTGCGATSRHSATSVARPSYTLHQVKAAFATEGITLDKMLRTRRLVVLRRAGWFGPFGYQRTGGWAGASGSYSLSHPPVTQFLVFVGNGRHSQQRGNVFVGYSEGEGQSVSAALRKLARSATR
jgi:hypothetical protein